MQIAVYRESSKVISYLLYCAPALVECTLYSTAGNAPSQRINFACVKIRLLDRLCTSPASGSQAGEQVVQVRNDLR